LARRLPFLSCAGDIWAFTSDDVAGRTAFAEIVEKTRAFLDDGGDWIAMKQGVVAQSHSAMRWASGPLYRKTADAAGG